MRKRVRRSGAGRERRNRLRGERGVKQIANSPNAIRNAKRHCWRRFQAFMDTAQIVVRDIQRHGGAMRLQLL